MFVGRVNLIHSKVLIVISDHTIDLISSLYAECGTRYQNDTELNIPGRRTTDLIVLKLFHFYLNQANS